ncbi:MAG: thiamine pyrophosphate-binding protein [Dehalococcoidales bacterium]|nr:thiamine pyrophosphate-binding protein [Dehalococcoidales bacterium]
MTKTTGKEALMQILAGEGIEYVFGVPGATEAHFLDAVREHPEISYILCLHELTAAGMAEGYTRACGKLACLNLHTNTGLAAALPMLSNACSGNVPMIITVGQQDTRLLAAEPAMSGDLVKIAAPFVKWATEVIHTEDIPMIMRRAFKVANHPPGGPVMVSFPLDVMAGAFDFDYTPGLQFFTRLHPDDDSIRIAVDLLSRSQNPVIIVEDGISRCQALAEVVRLAEITGARVYQPWMSDVNFPRGPPSIPG